MEKYNKENTTHKDFYDIMGDKDMSNDEKIKYRSNERIFANDSIGFTNYIVAKLDLSSKETTKKSIKALLKKVKGVMYTYESERRGSVFSIEISEKLQKI
ncbi:MAG: hypothetical protein BWK75_03430 [Candidatus Altiarchaeales archaeon A3]|nr:MAG: hypothetical protein BWK75_03430 [Candidatus Altiarchaeales archaeon A3]